MTHSEGLANQLRGSWNMLTGQAQMLTGAEYDDPEYFFTGVVNALQGRLQRDIGEHQARVASEALRTQWSGLSQETKGKILLQWGKWTDDPDAMAAGVVDLMQGRLDRYTGAAAREAGTALSDAGIALGDDAANNARQALAALFSATPAETPVTRPVAPGLSLLERYVNAIPDRAVRGDGTTACPPDYPVKGNADSGIYHTPDSPSYAQTIPEFCFASASVAEAAGFHAPDQ